MENDSQDLLKMLFESEEKFGITFENAPIGMAVLDLEGKFTRVNEALMELLGYSEPELQLIDFKAITHPEDVDVENVLFNKSLNGEIGSYRLKKRLIPKNADYIWCSVTTSILRDMDGLPVLFILHVQKMMADLVGSRPMDRNCNSCMFHGIKISKIEELYQEDECYCMNEDLIREGQDDRMHHDNCPKQIDPTKDNCPYFKPTSSSMISKHF